MAQTVRQNEVQLTVRIDGEDVKNSIADINKRYRSLNREIRKLTPGTEKFVQKSKEIAVAKNALDDAKSAARQFVKETKKVKSPLARIKNGLGSVAAAAGVAFGIDAVVGFSRELFSTATVLDTYGRKFETVFGEATAIVEEFSRANATAMGLSRAEYLKAATDIGDLLIPMGFQRNEAAQLASELVNLSGALAEWTGGTVNATETSEILRKALLGEREQLEQLGIKIMEADVSRRLAEKGQKSLTGAALEQAKALATLELIYEKSGDAQASFSENSNSLVRQQARIQASLTSLKEAVASSLIPAFDGLLGAVSGVLGAGDKLSDSMSEQQVQLNVLAGKVFQLNETDEERIRLINEMKSRYPDLLGDIDAQTISNAALRDAIGEVNEQLLNQIVIQARKEEIDEQIEKAARRKESALNNETYLRRQVARAVSEYNIQVDETASVEQQSIQVQEQLREKQSLWTRVWNGNQFAIERMTKARRDMNYFEERSNLALDEANEMTAEARTLAASLGVEWEKTNETREQSTTITQKSTEAQRERSQEEKSYQKLLEKREQLTKQVQKASIELQIELMPEGVEKEIAQVQQKLAAELEKLDDLDVGDDIKLQQRVLLRAQYNQEVARIEAQSRETRLDELRESYTQEIELIEGSSEEKMGAYQRLQSRTEQEAVNVIRQRSEAERAAVERAYNLRIEQIQSEQQRLETERVRIQRDSEGEMNEERVQEIIVLETQLTDLTTSLEEERSARLVQIQEEVDVQRVEFLRTLREQAATEAEELYKQELEELERFRAESTLEATQGAVSELEDGGDREEVEEQLRKRILVIEAEFLQQKVELQREFGETGLEDAIAIEQAKLEAVEERIAEEELLEQKKIEKIERLQGGVIEGIQSTGEVSQAVSAVRLAVLEREKQKELDFAGDNEQAKAKIEEEYREKRIKAERQAAAVQKTLEIGRAVMNVAASILKTGADLGYPQAIPFQIYAGIVGGAQIAKIAATPLATGGVTTSNEKATITKMGDQYYWENRPVVRQRSFAGGGSVSVPSLALVGEKGPEWVAPNWMLNSPIYGPVIGQLEKARLQGYESGGTTFSYGATHFTSQVSAQQFPRFVRTQAFAEGGPSNIPSNESIQMTSLQTDNSELLAKMGEMTDLLRNPQFVTMVTERDTANFARMQHDYLQRRSR